MAYKRKDYNMSDAAAEKQEAQQRRWHKENYERISIDLKKGARQRIKDRAAQNGESVQGYIRRLIEDDINNN